MSSYLTASGAYDRRAIARAAWAMARARMVPHRPLGRLPVPPVPTLREAFAYGMRRAWDLARGERAGFEHAVAHDTEQARRATLPAIEREVLALRSARAIAPMIDSLPAMLAELARIDARAAALGVRL